MLRRVVSKGFSLVCNSMCAKLANKTWNFFAITSKFFKIWIFICILIASIWLLGIYNCCKDAKKLRRVVSKGFFTTLLFNMCKVSKETLKFLCYYFKIWLFICISIASIWLLGIYNCCSKMLRSWEEWYQKVFSLLCNSTCAKLVKTLKFLCDYFKIWLFICILLLLFDS